MLYATRNENVFYLREVDLDDTPAEAAFRAEIRAWLDANAVPRGHPDDFSAGIWSDEIGEDRYVERCQWWQRRLHDAGWAGITWPAEFGGRGGRPIQQVIWNQEQARYGVSVGIFMVAHGMVAPTLMAHGSREQQARFLPPMLRGEDIWCQLFSEPGAGSDLAGISTRAVRDGDEWVVTGQKVWTSSAHRAPWGILLARTDSDVPKHAGITYFVLDMASPGIDIRPLRQMTGDSHFSEVFLDSVRIPSHNVVGEVGGGWRVALTTLASERGAIAGGSQGADPPALIRLARCFGRADDPTTRQRLVQAHIHEGVLRFLRYRTQTALSQGKSPGAEASVMKLAYARYMKHLTELGIEVQGAAGMLAGERLPDAGVWLTKFLHTPSLRIAGGSDQIQANIIAERVLGLPSESRVDRDVPFRELSAAGGAPR
jgi:alkylation response protein AidB-like acyl-CoA dehydrogenase